MQFPDDAVLLARGKYSTLGKERRAQLERIQKACQTLMNSCSQALRDCEARPPVTAEPLRVMGNCLENITEARGKVVDLCAEMELLKALAWEGQDDA